MTWVQSVGGCLGAAAGGGLSDHLGRRFSPLTGRLLVLAVSNVIAAPLAAGVLLLPAPASFYLLFCTNIFGEMWMGVTMAAIVHIVPVSATRETESDRDTQRDGQEER